MLGVRACLRKRALRVVLAVRAGENGDERLRTHLLDGGGDACLRFMGKALNRAAVPRLCRVDGFEHGVVQRGKLFDGGTVRAEGNGLFRCGDADAHGVGDFIAQLGDNRAWHGGEPVKHRIFRGEADLVAEGHLHHRLGKAVFDRPRTHDLARARKRGETLPRGGLLLGRFACEEVDAVAHRLQVGRQQLAFEQRRDGEGDERRRHIAVKKAAGHGVLAADGGGAQLQLRVQRAEQRREGLAPTRGLIAELFKKFLQGKICLMIVCACGDELGDRGIDRVVRTAIGVGAQRVGVAAPGHHAALRGLLAGEDGQERRHRLRGAALRPAAKGHEERPRADGGVEALDKTAAGRALEAARHAAQRLSCGGSGTFPRGDGDGGVLRRAVGVEEGAGEVGDRLSAPAHDHAGAFGHDRHAVGL